MNEDRSRPGGDRRALYPTRHEEARIGMAVLKEMFSEGGPFRSELDAIGCRYRRTIRVIAKDSPPLDTLGRRLEAVDVGRPIHYPRRAPSAAALAEWERRSQVAENVEATELHGQLDGVEVSVHMRMWAHQPLREAAAEGKTRRSSRKHLRQYISAVREFAARWNLRAAWALPLLVNGHLVWQETGKHGRFDRIALGSGRFVEWQIVAQVPGTAADRFERDASTLRRLRSEHDLANDDLRVVEERIDSAAVLVLWSPGLAREAGSYVRGVVSERLGRELSTYEARVLGEQLASEIREARSYFIEGAGYRRMPPEPDDRRAVQFVAKRLLGQSYRRITDECGDGNRRWLDERSVRRAAHRLASRAGLVLP